MNSAVRPRFTAIHNPERVKLVAIIPNGILLLASLGTALGAVSSALIDRKNFQL